MPFPFSRHRVVIAILCMLMVVSRSTCAADEGPLYRWRFQQSLVQNGRFKPVAGDRAATMPGPLSFSKTKPQALVLAGDAEKRHGISIPNAPDQLQLPSQDITVSAWVLVEKSQEWGGICGVIQDNGDYERGWLLGYRQSNFFFAVSAENKKRLTYLTDPRSFETGYWYHVVGTYDGKQISLYVDGKLRAVSAEQTGKIAYPSQVLFSLGAYHDENEYYPLTGQLEQVSVHDRSLTAAEVAREFGARKSLFPEIDAVIPNVTGWPTYLRDNQRTGTSRERLTLPLHLAWVHRARHPPQPAWPAPAKQDFWNKRHNLRPRVVYDRAYHVVAVGDSAWFASSADDKVYCLDADTGEERWAFFTEGPVRLAPTLYEGKLLFGSDDGHVYCLSAADGSLLWQYRHDAQPDRLIAGNGRIINALPVRTGVLIDDGIAYFCAGLFPSQAVYQVALNVNTGKHLASGRINISAQGYLERRSGRLFVPSGRNPAGAFASQLKRRGKSVGKDVSELPKEYPYSFVGAADIRFGGGDGKVSGFRADDGKQLWTAEVKGKAYGISIANQKLYVSTDAGLIYCFTPKQQKPRQIEPPADEPFSHADENLAARREAAAKDYIESSEIRQGYCLLLGAADGGLACNLARHSDLKIVCLEKDEVRISAVRKVVDAAGLAGRVVVHRRRLGDSLPYSDYLFNLVISQPGIVGGEVAVPRDEVVRVLRPKDGVAYLGPGKEDIVRRPPLEGVGEWTHMYADAANTVCSTDTKVRGEMALQWFGRPGPREMIDRHHRTVAPLWKDGRLFIPGNDRVYVADAYNGTPLWTREFPNSRRTGAFRDCSYMAVGDDLLFVAAEDRCVAINAKNGYVRHTFTLPQSDDAKERDWGYVASVDRLLIGSGVKLGASRRAYSRDAIMEGSYFDFRHIVTSDFLFAFDSKDARHQWTYTSMKGAIPNSTITAGGGKMFFVESHNKATLQTSTGRAPLSELLSKGADFVALDMKSGKEAWRIDGKFTAAQHNIYCSYARDKVVLVGSRNSGTDRETARVMYDVFVFDASTGRSIWQTTQTQPTRIGGDHGEQDLHPVIVGNKLFCEPFAYELDTGKRIKDWGWANGKRRGCGTISASASTFFFRQSNPTMFDLTTGKQTPVTTSTRPGCWINIIPAGGLLLIPEASSGCTCDYAVQTSLAFLPVR